ncbi:peroxiredoxin [Nocardia rhizosphaerae]|uniref:thioredoxin-dependent peroxiredoxin n=1 Tax=Nocardia rhizosphaerae TaxID=1691571 RepID=A0ABV8KXZ6_9NOCA
MQPGQRAPEFALPDQSAQLRTIDDLLAGGPLVLFFYPAANTPVCTAEACHFRDLSAEFAAIGASCAGISTDSAQVQAGFATKQRLDYPLLSDADGTVAAAFGVKRGLLGKLAPVKRHTFVIDTDRTILKVVTGELRAAVHADEALAFLRDRAEAIG